MKKLFLILAVAVLGVFTAHADKAQDIVNKYLEITGSNKDFAKEHNVLQEMTMTMQGMEGKVKVISQKPGDNMRFEMDIMGQKVVYIVSGDKAWMSAMGQTREVPMEEIESMKSQMSVDIAAQFFASKEGVTFEYVGEEDGKISIKILMSEEGTENMDVTAIFDNETSLLDKIIMDVQGQNVEISTTDYKDFNGVLRASVISTVAGGNEVMKMEITKYQLDGFLIMPYMFAEPK